MNHLEEKVKSQVSLLLRAADLFFKEIVQTKSFITKARKGFGEDDIWVEQLEGRSIWKVAKGVYNALKNQVINTLVGWQPQFTLLNLKSIAGWMNNLDFPSKLNLSIQLTVDHSFIVDYFQMILCGGSSFY